MSDWQIDTLSMKIVWKRVSISHVKIRKQTFKFFFSPSFIYCQALLIERRHSRSEKCWKCEMTHYVCQTIVTVIVVRLAVGVGMLCLTPAREVGTTPSNAIPLTEHAVYRPNSHPICPPLLSTPLPPPSRTQARAYPDHHLTRKVRVSDIVIQQILETNLF